MTLTPETIKKVAKLARIHVLDSDVPRLTQEVSGIMGWIEQLGEVNTDAVEPLYNVVSSILPQREDKAIEGHQRDAVLANAPESDYGCFVVPKVIE